ncbi:YidC family membrane integrase SpoIIIJ [Ectobacillus antri]|uniref:Membrane protein insertase YidC n=1 Tax=Ectobacillus antri TaxID=2486280 RepID=A0ABT6H9H5_9BACI|nr:YidC family membrane integrase SpoIIIJ [Ectobacillus antri]MDG4657552.1 YidC family membrane integrase SpoIIIJ [Ectobacillus antri]MDG5755156.1 YidC family membrane integrase SpoIIIJ [Ectobacillus antri]
MKKKITFLVMMMAFMAVITGCSEVNKPITPESEGVWNEYFVYPLSQLITFFAELFNNDYGLSIVVVTIIIRLALLPLMIKQTKSTKAMQMLQPEMVKLREKYASKDQVTQQKLQQEMMQLYQKHGVNPLSGCLPIFIQMPVLFAFYHAIMRTMEIKQHSFLWFDLGHPDPIYVLPIVAGITTFIQQKIAMKGTPPNPQMTMMLWLMPIMILIFAINFPAALSLYWVVGNIFSIAQTYFIKGPTLKETEEGASK